MSMFRRGVVYPVYIVVEADITILLVVIFTFADIINSTVILT